MEVLCTQNVHENKPRPDRGWYLVFNYSLYFLPFKVSSSRRLSVWQIPLVVYFLPLLDSGPKAELRSGRREKGRTVCDGRFSAP
jgi:hypothetical protein